MSYTKGPWEIRESFNLGNEAEAAADEIDRLRARIAELERACEVFVTWLDREEAGFANVGARGTPTGEAEWREWYDENLRLCSLAQSLARAAIEKATKP